MKLYLDCYPCVLNQTLSACRFLGVSEPLQKEIFTEALEILRNADPESPSPILVADVQAVIRSKTGNPDPYQKQKRDSTKKALALYPQMKNIIEQSDTPFDTAVRLSIAGNIIDFGVSNSFDLSTEIERVLSQPYTIDHTIALYKEIQKANTILYLADNAGETVFDRLLIETINKNVLYVVKGSPVLNDAIMEDAVEAGLDQVAEVISSGADTPGTVLSRCSKSFQDTFHNAELIISKGQGNYEALSNRNENIFFLLQAKCEIVAREFGASVGSMIAMQARESRNKEN